MCGGGTVFILTVSVCVCAFVCVWVGVCGCVCYWSPYRNMYTLVEGLDMSKLMSLSLQRKDKDWKEKFHSAEVAHLLTMVTTLAFICDLQHQSSQIENTQLQH